MVERTARGFKRHSGIDYSAAQAPVANQKNLRVYRAEGGEWPAEVFPPPSPRKYWTRRDIAEWVLQFLSDDVPAIVGIDHSL
jgi:hypothetical protein